MIIRKGAISIVFMVLLIGIVGIANTAYSKGCVKGAVIGGLAGHFLGHHGLVGAAAGCAIVHHQESKQNRLKQSNSTPTYQYPNQNRPYTQPQTQKGVTYY